MKSLDHVVFVSRQSPDWELLARDYEAGMTIDPSRYEPPPGVPGFPDDLVECIRIWNITFKVNFFRCRQVLKDISGHTVQQVRNSIFLRGERLADLPALVADTRFLLFFFDDDDWFAPDMFEHLSKLDLGQRDIAVFPLVRFGEDVLTFVRKEETARAIVGMRVDFGYRFQTNNYGIPAGIALSKHLPNLKDHMLGSIYVDQMNLSDRYFDILISATNKTPCAASSIGRLLEDPSLYHTSVQQFVENLKSVHIPPDLAWMAAPLNATLMLCSSL